MDQNVSIPWLQCSVAAELGIDFLPKRYLADITYWQPGWEQLPYTALKRGGKCGVLCAGAVCSLGRSEDSYPRRRKLPSSSSGRSLQTGLSVQEYARVATPEKKERKALATDFIHLIGFATSTQIQHFV